MTKLVAQRRQKSERNFRSAEEARDNKEQKLKKMESSEEERAGVKDCQELRLQRSERPDYWQSSSMLQGHHSRC